MAKFLSAIFMIFTLTSHLHAQTRVWDISYLERLKREQSVQVLRIETEADKFLKKQLSSVVDKKKPAPSGDFHDYISCGAYWWPNPKDPTGAYIRRDGEKNKDVLTPDKINLSAMSKSVILLSLAYYFTEKEQYATKAVENLRLWFIAPETRMNPNLNYGQTIYGYRGGMGRGAGLIDTYQFVNLLDAVELLKSSPAFTPDIRDGLQSWFKAYLMWMRNSPIGHQECGAKNNHGTAYDVQAARIALFIGSDSLAQSYIRQFPARRMFPQIEPDGKQPEELARTKAMHYSVFNLTHMIDMSMMARTMHINLFDSVSDDGRSISKAFEYLSRFVGKSQSHFPYKQINEWNESVQRLRIQLYRADQLSSKNSYTALYADEINAPDFLIHIFYY